MRKTSDGKQTQQRNTGNDLPGYPGRNYVVMPRSTAGLMIHLLPVDGKRAVQTKGKYREFRRAVKKPKSTRRSLVGKVQRRTGWIVAGRHDLARTALANPIRTT